MNLWLNNKPEFESWLRRPISFEVDALPILMIVGLAASLSMFWWSYMNGVAVAYGDAASHLNIARRLIEGLTPGATQIGGVWLPLPHVLMLLFVWSDGLWHTGLAGGIVGGLAFLGTVYYTFRLAEILTENRTVAFITSLIVVSNPNLLYLQTTPMGESLFLFTLVASAYFLTRWSLTRSIGSLVLAALFGLLSTLVRYEGWFFIAAGTLTVIVLAYRWGGFKRAEGLGITFALLAGFGPLLWFLWNWAIFGNPLYFLSGNYSAQSQQGVLEGAGLLPTAHNLSAALHYYFSSVGETCGFLLVWLALFFLPFLFWRERRYRIVILLFLSVALFEVAALYFGITALYLPTLPPEGSLFNVRYGLLMLPLVALVMANLFSWRHLFIGAGLGTLMVLQIFFLYRDLPITLKEPLQFQTISENKQATGGKFLKEAYVGGRILLVPISNDPFIFHTGLLMQEFVTEGNRGYWKDAVHRPEKHVEWIVFDTGVNYFTLEEQGSIDFAFQNFYRLEWSRGGLLIYKRLPRALSVADSIQP